MLVEPWQQTGAQAEFIGSRGTAAAVVTARRSDWVPNLGTSLISSSKMSEDDRNPLPSPGKNYSELKNDKKVLVIFFTISKTPPTRHNKNLQWHPRLLCPKQILRWFPSPESFQTSVTKIHPKNDKVHTPSNTWQSVLQWLPVSFLPQEGRHSDFSWEEGVAWRGPQNIHIPKLRGSLSRRPPSESTKHLPYEVDSSYSWGHGFPEKIWSLLPCYWRKGNQNAAHGTERLGPPICTVAGHTKAICLFASGRQTDVPAVTERTHRSCTPPPRAVDAPPPCQGHWVHLITSLYFQSCETHCKHVHCCTGMLCTPCRTETGWAAVCTIWGYNILESPGVFLIFLDRRLIHTGYSYLSLYLLYYTIDLLFSIELYRGKIILTGQIDCVQWIFYWLEQYRAKVSLPGQIDCTQWFYYVSTDDAIVI